MLCTTREEVKVEERKRVERQPVSSRPSDKNISCSLRQAVIYRQYIGLLIAVRSTTRPLGSEPRPNGRGTTWVSFGKDAIEHNREVTDG
jgi:hypothetical protein